MAGDLPTVFLSSTFYDLRQVRKDLFEFIENELGYRALASEHQSFPVDPDADTIENCRRRVNEDADILVLVVGGRYGSPLPSGEMSVTNLEYVLARSKRIPVYVFVLRDVRAVMPTWEANPSADFSKTVDTPKLFDFIKQIGSSDRVWLFPFEKAQDIVETLRTQFGFLMSDGLQIGLRLRSANLDYSEMSANCLRLALEQPDGWHARVLAQAIIDEIHSYRDLGKAYEMRISYGPGEIIAENMFLDWVRARLVESQRLVLTLSALFSKPTYRAATDGDVSHMMFVAREIGRLYKAMIEWSFRIERAHITERYLPLMAEIARITESLVVEFETFGTKLMAQIDEAAKTGSEGPIALTAMFSVTISNADRISAEFAKLGIKIDSK